MGKQKISRNVKYLVVPGYIESKNDSNRHYINANKLMRLYNVNPNDCLIYKKESRGIDFKDYHVLGVDYQGKYQIPNEVRNKNVENKYERYDSMLDVPFELTLQNEEI